MSRLLLQSSKSMIARSLWKFMGCLCPHAASMCIRHKRTQNHDPEMYYNELKSIDNDRPDCLDHWGFGALSNALSTKSAKSSAHLNVFWFKCAC